MDRTLRFLLLASLALVVWTQKTEERTNIRTIFDLLVNIGRDYYYENNEFTYPTRYDCPLCDSSVYSYCSEKLLHDACCCLNPHDHHLPYQCRYADCSFLHANTCEEHKLITACCCSRLFKKSKPPI